MKYFLAIGFFILSQFVTAQTSFTLEDAVQYGIRASKNVQLDAIAIRDADLDVRKFIALGLPNISGKGQYQYFFDKPKNVIPETFFNPQGDPNKFTEISFGTNHRVSGSLTLNQLIFDGSFFTGIKAQKAYKELITKNVDQTKYDVRNKVTKAYLQVLLSNENLKIIDKNLSNLEASLEETKTFYENGFAEKLDLYRLELSIDNLRNSQKNVQRLQEIAVSLLKFQMNYPTDEPLELTQTLDDLVDKIITQEVKDPLKISFDKRPEYQKIVIGERLNKIKLTANKNARYPSLYGFANHEQLLQRDSLFDSNSPGFTKTTIAGLQLNVPIYAGGQKHIEIQKTKLEIEKTRIQKEEFMRGVTLQVENQYTLFVNAKNQVNIAKRSEAMANDIYEIAKVKYAEGVGSSLERTQAERDVFQAESNYMQALYDLVVAKVEYDIARGELQDYKY